MTAFYFTGTGNSLHIAKEIEGDKVVGIPDVLNGKIKIDCSDDKIGIVFPVYCFAPPMMVIKFCELIKNEIKGKYVYVIANFAGMAGAPANFIFKELGQIDAYFEVVMPSNDVFMTRVANDAEAEKIIKKANQKLLLIKQKIENRERNNYQRGFLKNLLSLWGKKIFDLFASPDVSKNFIVDRNRCVKCGLCAKICPSMNIVFGAEGFPDFLKNCTYCSGCINRCPKDAISYKNRCHKVQYVNPILKNK